MPLRAACSLLGDPRADPVATPRTETRWRDAAAGKNVRQIEDLVAGHRHGDQPDDSAAPEARTHVVRLELGAEVFARLRQVRAALTAERGGFVDDDHLVTALCDAVLDRAADPGAEPTGRAKFQIAVTVCARCARASQEGGGAAVPIDAAALDRARCDAQHVGSIDGDAPERAYQDIPPSVVRFVWRRDGGQCQTPGCRSSVGLGRSRSGLIRRTNWRHSVRRHRLRPQALGAEYRRFEPPR